jgi:hypothetical protein
MAIQIQFRRGTAAEWESVNPTLALAEMGIETDTDLFKIGDGNTLWNDLDYGGLRGYAGSMGSIGYTAVDNVLYVSKSGNDSNDGRSLTYSKLTIKSAVAAATRGTTIFVKSGDYTEVNPINVPDFVSIVGDNLRSVTVRTQNVTQDLFYVNNGVYIAHMTFKDHVSPAAAIAFNPNGSAGVISTSPYVQNCTSMTSSGTGMRIDGNHASGLKSMVVDAFTQYNQGGIGIHIINNGYAQLVSVFTICCDVGFLTESGGSCSITNSNSSFGNYALKSIGVSPTQYTGKVNGAKSGRTFVIDNLSVKPGIGDAISFGTGDYYTISSSTVFKTGSINIVHPTLTAEDAALRNARQSILDERTRLQVETVDHVMETFPGFDFNQFKCSRDVGTILDGICYDMVLNTNYQTIKAGTSYYRAATSVVVSEQLTETLSAVTFLKLKTLLLLTPSTTAYTRVSYLFDMLLDIMTTGESAAPAINFNPPTGAPTSTYNAVVILQANKSFIAEETVAYTSGFTYNEAYCYRDTGLIVDSVAFDLLYGGTSQGAFAALQYWNHNGYTGDISREITTTSLAIAYARDLAVSVANLAGGVIPASTVTNNFNTLLSIINSGTSGVTDLIIPNGVRSTDSDTVAAYNALLANKTIIQDSTISWIDSNYPAFSYNQELCSRDTGLIVDSLSFDLLYGGTSQSAFAALQYWSHNGYTGEVGREITTTTLAIAHARDLAVSVVNAAGGTIVATTVTNNFNTLLHILTSGTSGATDLIIPNGITSVDSNTVAAYDALLANKTSIQDSTISWIDSNYPAFGYNQDKCSRDTGLIVDSLAFDLLYDGTSQSEFAALQYWSHNGYTGEIGREISTTTLAIIHARDLAVSVVAAAAGPIPATTVTNSFNALLYVLNEGPTGVTDLIVPNGAPSTDGAIINAYNALLADKTTIQDSTISWIYSSYPEFTYNTSTCYRDIGYIVDSVAFDLLHGGNRQSIMSAVYYYGFSTSTVIANEIPQTTAAYDFIKTIASDIIQGIPVTTTYQNTLTQTITSNTATSVEATLIVNKINTITNIISNGPSVASAHVPIGLTANTSTAVTNAFDLLLANRDFIRAETIGYINKFYSYDRDICRRDVGYIIDSAAFDLLHGGNRQSVMSAVYYYGFSTSTVIANEIPQTTAAYDFIKTIAANVITGTPVTTPYQNVVTQVISSNTATSVEAALIVNKINTITNIIVNGPSVASAHVPIGLTPINDSMLVNAFTLLQSNRDFIRAETIAYIDKFYSYNRTTCRRDVGYIVDSVAFDLLHGGNRQSIMGAVYYYGFNSTSTVIANEIPQTTAAYEFIKSISSDIITGNLITATYQTSVSQTVSTSTATYVEIGLINDKISTITNIINYGPSVAPAHVPIGLTASTSTAVVNAFDLLLANRAFIQAETVAFINTSYVGLIYSTATCKRDVGYIIDAVSYDLLYGGNSQTAHAADSYYDGNVFRISGTEKLATIAAYEFIKDVIDELVVNTLITPHVTEAVQDITHPAATAAESATAQSLVDIIANIVQNAYSSTITLEETVPLTINDNSPVTFHQYSLITSSGHSFEWIGAGVNINSALPFTGGEPNSANQAVEVDGGKVYFTGTDQRGDFRIGNGLVINRNLGTISGRTFTKSLFAVMTPYILAIGK